MFWALTYISGAVTAIIVGSSPLVTALITHFFTEDEKLNRQKIFGICLGVSGIIAIAFHKLEFSTNSFFLPGIILLFLAVTSGSTGNIIVSKKKSLLSPVTLNSMQMISGGTLMIITNLIINGRISLPKAGEFYFALLWLSFVSAAAFSIWFILLKHKNVKVSDLNVWKFIIPVFGGIFSWLFVPGEHPELITVTGMIIAAVSIIVYNIKTRPQN